MSTKTVHIDGVGDIAITKRRGQKAIRATINGSTVKVSQPTWLPFAAGEKFIEQRLPWIKEHIKVEEKYSEGSLVGHNKALRFKRASRATLGMQLTEHEATVLLPPHTYPEDEKVQHYIRKKIESLLRNNAEDYLPSRVAELAKMFGFSYKSVQVKLLKRRWGSCNSKKELVFNLHLMSLDTLHIDYVILHELCHTRHMNHGAEFWREMELVMPGAKKIAKDVRHYAL